MKINKDVRFGLRMRREDKANVRRLAARWHVSESEAIRLSVLQSLQSDRLPQLPARMRRPRSIRRKVTG
jgi:hypothetical protein